MNAAKLIAMMGSQRGFYGGSLTTPPIGATAIPWPTGTRSQDIAIIQTYDGSSGAALSTSGWVSTNSPVYGGTIYTKTLNAADLTATATFATAGQRILLVLVFRGFSGINELSNQGEADPGSPPDTKSWTGFTKGGSCRGLVLLSGASDSAGPALTITSPALASKQAGPGGVTSGGGDSFLNASFFDLVPSEYTNGAAVGVAGYGTTWNQRFFAAFELT